MKVLVNTTWKESILLSADDMSPLEEYSFLHWLDHAYSAATSLTSETVCVEAPELRKALEEFLFTAQFSDRSTSSKLQTGFGQWRKLGQLPSLSTYPSEDNYGEQTGRATMTKKIWNQAKARLSAGRQSAGPGFHAGDY
jgi:hypothetical protein